MKKLFLFIGIILVLLTVTSIQGLAECDGDFDTDGDVDGSDLAVFAADFGRTDCISDCEGDFDADGDVDGSDLALFATDFGRTDCQKYSNESLAGTWFSFIDSVIDIDHLGAYFVFDGNGIISDVGAFNQLTPPGTYEVETDGSFIIGPMHEIHGGFGQIISATEASVAFDTYDSGIISGKLIKVTDLSVCQGTWNGTFVEMGTSNTYDVEFLVSPNGEITYLGGSFNPPLTGKMFSEIGLVSSFLKTGETGSYNQILIIGTLSGDNLTGTYEIDNSTGVDGTVSLTRIVP